jgi:hypothetical protein
MFISVFRNTFLHGGTPKTNLHFPRNPTYEKVYMSGEVCSGDPFHRHPSDGFVKLTNGHKHNTNKDNRKYELTEKKTSMRLVAYGP